MSQRSSGRLLLLAAVVQCGGWLLAAGVHTVGLLSGMGLLLVAGLSAAGLAWLFRLPHWWVWIELLFPAAVAIGAGLDLPAFVPAFLLAFALLLFGGEMVSRVPLWLSGRRAQAVLCANLPSRRDLDVIDLGGGLGGMLLALWRSGRCARCTGIEWAPLPFLAGWLRLRLAGFPGSWRFGSLWAQSLGSHDLVYAFLSPAAMPALWTKARTEMREGSWLVSYRFEIPGVPPDQRWLVGEAAEDVLLLWVMPGPGAS